MSRRSTDQERFWAGEFGTEYTRRNRDLAGGRQPFFADILRRTGKITSVCELGANTGENLRAIRSVNPKLRLTGVEINPEANRVLSSIPDVDAHCVAIQDFKTATRYDLVFTAGVLIHIAPVDLPDVYDKIYALSARYVLLNEYFNPTPVEVEYRGHSGKLFKRDFAGDFMERYVNQVTVAGYGFLWKKVEPAWDDTTWTLFEKTGGSTKP